MFFRATGKTNYRVGDGTHINSDVSEKQVGTKHSPPFSGKKCGVFVSDVRHTASGLPVAPGHLLL